MKYSNLFLKNDILKHRNARMWCVILLFVWLSFFSKAFSQVDKPISAGEVLAKLIESEREIKDVQAHFSAILIENNFPFYEYDWGYEGGKEFMRGIENATETMEIDDNKIYCTTNTETAFDGEKTYFWRHDLDHIEAGLPSRGAVAPLDGSVFKLVITPNVLLGFCAHEKGRLSCGEAIAQADSYSVNPEIELVDGHPCYVIEALGVEYDPELPTLSWDVKVWIDYQRDFRPLKIEKYWGIEGRNRWKVLNQRVDNIRLEKVDGIWFPVEGISSHFTIKETKLPEGMTDAEFIALSPEERQQQAIFEIEKSPPACNVKIDPNSIEINKGIPPEKFTIQFPHGCRVYDEFAQIGYIVGAEEEVSLPTLDDTKGGTDLAKSKKNDGMETKDAKGAREENEPEEQPVQETNDSLKEKDANLKQIYLISSIAVLVAFPVFAWFYKVRRRVRRR